MKTKPRVAGIIVEYNPFHNGHLYHIEKTREITQCDVLVAVMSPNFVQRGEPAYVDKWVRTKAGLNRGVDLVIELPTHLTLQSAETFAKTALQILAWAQVDSIVYGSETLDTPILLDPNMASLKEGFSYAYAKNTQGMKPNQILGAYYEKYAKEHTIVAKQILRTNSYSSLDIEDSKASASAIRYNHQQGLDITHTTPLNLDEHVTTTLNEAYNLIQYQLITDTNLKSYLLVDEGIENLFIKLAKQHDDLESFIAAAISKRYTRSRIQRTLCHILLKTPRVYPDMETARVLGMNQTGQNYLRTLKSERLVTSFKKHSLKDLEEKSTLVYDLFKQKGTPSLAKEVGPPIII